MLYKILGPDRQPIHGGSGSWPEPGTWTAPQQVIPCRSGYHLCRTQDISAWLKPGMEIWEAEGSGEAVTADNKVVYEQARLLRKLPPVTDKLLRLFAADCAERVLSIFEQQFPDDGRPRAAIQAVRAYVDGKIGEEELRAARAAARAAAGAAEAAEAAGAAAGAAGAAGAAWAAAGAAGAAGAAEAAWAAGDAEAAGDAAAWAAAGATAWAAAVRAGNARAAAHQQERLWQGNHFLELLTG